MPREPRINLWLKFEEEEARKLKRLCRKQKITMQAFGHASIMRSVNEATLGKKVTVQIMEEKAEEEKKILEPATFGIRERLQRLRSEDVERPALAPAPAPTSARVDTGDSEIVALARTVIASPPTSRSDVLKAACRALARGRSQEEGLRLADELDAMIRRLDGPRSALDRARERMGE